MGTAMKLLMMSALLKMMGSCQGTNCFFGPGNNTHFLEVADGGFLSGGATNAAGARVVIPACFDPQCQNGIWKYTGVLNPNCGKCYFGGEPLVYTFDPLRNTKPRPNPGPPNPVLTSNLISVDSKDDEEYVMTQPGFGKPGSSTPAFGVTGHFTDSAAGGPCSGPPGPHGYTNCIDGFIYYDTANNIGVKVVLDSWGRFKVYWHAGYLKWGAPTGAPNWQDTDSSTPLPGSEIIVIEPANIIAGGMISRGGRICIIFIGSKGFTVTLCKEDAFSVPGYPWSGIYAMPSLQSIAPVKDALYGLCNAWTGGVHDYFYKGPFSGGASGKPIGIWQEGLTKDHLTGDKDIRKLRNGVAKTWRLP